MVCTILRFDTTHIDTGEPDAVKAARPLRRRAKHARISRHIAEIIAGTDQEKDGVAALRIGCLVLGG